MPERVGVIITTYCPDGEDGAERLEGHEAFAEGLKRLEGVDLELIVVDDGTDQHWQALQKFWRRVHAATGWPLTVSRASRQGVGASLNRGIEIAAQDRLDYTLYAVDDWLLTQKLDLSFAVGLMEDPMFYVGCVRLGPPHPMLRGFVQHTEGYGWFLRPEREHSGYVFAQRPALYHRRFWEVMGKHPEGMNAMDTERIYNERYLAMSTSPEVWIAMYSPWEVIPNPELGYITP